MSDDGRFAIVLIALLGNPFSPEAYRARRRGRGDAHRFASMNVALYGPRLRSRAWALDERAASATAAHLRIGASSLRWEGDALAIELDERSTPAYPLRRPIRGSLRVVPEVRSEASLALDRAGEHRWWPLAPRARIEVALEAPAIRFSGRGYLDANAGARPLEASFSRWSWLRADAGDASLLTYDVRETSGGRTTHALRVAPSGALEALGPTTSIAMPRGRWGVRPEARVDPGAEVRVLRSLEDGPFYTRALIETTLGGESVQAVHESLDAQRLRKRWVRFCTAHRMRSDVRPRLSPWQL